MRIEVILDSSFARPGSAPIWGGKKGEFRDWTNSSKVLGTLDSMKELAPIALDCVRSYQAVNPSSVFTIADYGSADGGTSMPLIYSCVEELRKLHGSELEILIF